MNEQTPAETELLHLAQGFDLIALAKIYDLYSPDIHRYAMRLLGNTTLAEDCVSETFSRFLHALAAGKGPRDYLRAYLYRIAHNWITDHYRREHPSEELTETIPDETQRIEEKADRAIQHSRILQAIHELSPNQQQVIALKYWQDLDNKEIARALGKPVGAIKSLQHRAIISLQRKLRK